MTTRKICLGLVATFLILFVVVLSYLNPVSALAETYVFTDLDSFLLASGSLTAIDFENLPAPASSDPNNWQTEYIPNPLVLQGVTFTDPVLLRTDFCSASACETDPDSPSGGSIITYLNQGATINAPVGTGGALLVIAGMDTMTFTLRVTDFMGNSIDVDSQATLNNPTYLGFTSTNGIQQIEVFNLGVPEASLALATLYVEFNDPDVTVGVWADPTGDVEPPNGDLIWGSAIVQDETVDLRVRFLEPPFLKSEGHDITWCFNTDDNAATGTACGYTGADAEFTLSGGTDSLFGGPVSFDGALSALDPCSVSWYDWDTNTLRLMIPLSLISNNNTVAFALEGIFEQKDTTNTLQTYMDLAPDVADFSVTGSFFSSTENEFAPFNGVPLCSPYKEMSVSIQATGTVEFFPEFGILRNAPVLETVQSSYFKTTNENRRFRRGFIELTIPDLPDEVEIAEATLILPETGATTTVPIPAVTHTVNYYHAADLVINTNDYNRSAIPVSQTFVSDANSPNDTFSIDVTDAINSNHEGEAVGFMIKLAVDPTFDAVDNFGTGFTPSSAMPPRVFIRLAQARADVDAESGGTLLYTNDQGLQIEVVAPAGAVSDATRLALESGQTNLLTGRPMIDVPNASGTLVQINSDFTLNAYQGGRPRSGSILQEPITVTLHCADSDVSAINENTLLLHYWNGSNWEYAACGLYERHPDENWLAVPICYFGSQFALFGLPVEVDEPVAGLTAINDGPKVLGQSMVLTATITSGTNVSYSWDFGDGETGSGAAVTHTYPAVGEYTAVVTASNSINELVTTTIVSVTDESIIGLNAINDGPTKLGQSTILTATITSGTNVSYSWAFGDGETGSGATVSHTYPAIGEYTAVLTASNSISTIVITTPVSITVNTSGSTMYTYLPIILGKNP